MSAWECQTGTLVYLLLLNLLITACYTELRDCQETGVRFYGSCRKSRNRKHRQAGKGERKIRQRSHNSCRLEGAEIPVLLSEKFKVVLCFFVVLNLPRLFIDIHSYNDSLV